MMRPGQSTSFRLAGVVLLLWLLAAGTTFGGDLPEHASVSDLGGQSVRFVDYCQGRLNVVLLWKGCCSSGKRLLIEIEDLRVELEGENVSFVAVSMDTPRELSRLKSYLKARKPGVPVLHDPDMLLARGLNPGGLQPYTLLLDAEQSIVYQRSGYRNGDVKRLGKEIRDRLEAAPALSTPDED